MSTEIARHLDEATRFFRRGVEARGRGEPDAARRYFLQASEELYLAAKDSKGRLKETRAHLAGELLNEAEALHKRGPVRPALSGKPAPKARVQQDDDESHDWLVYDRPDISFEDVAGLEDVKEQIRLKLLYPFIYPDQASRYKIEPGGGILLYGPPGTGKTMIARAVAGEIEAAFFAIKPSYPNFKIFLK